MANKLTKECSKALSALVSRLESEEKFVVEQAPDFCKEILSEKVLYANMSLIGCSIVAVTCFLILLFCFLKARHDSNYYTGVFLAGFLITPFLVEGWISLNLLMTVKKCPKLVVLRELKRMID